MKFEVSPEYLLHLMKLMLEQAGKIPLNEFAKLSDTHASVYKKLNDERVGFYHEQWVEYLHGPVCTSSQDGSGRVS